MTKQIKEQLEEIIKKNLPEKKDESFISFTQKENVGFNQALSQINTSLIADELLKVVVETLEKQFEDEDYFGQEIKNFIINLLTNSSTIEGERSEHLSLNKENEEYNNSSVKIDPPKPPFSGLHYQG